jgi:hypothetical protein
MHIADYIASGILLVGMASVYLYLLIRSGKAAWESRRDLL